MASDIDVSDLSDEEETVEYKGIQEFGQSSTQIESLMNTLDSAFRSSSASKSGAT